VNEEDIPSGTYLTSCNGCALVEDKTKLQCSQCPNGLGRWVPVGPIAVDLCKNFANVNGKLTCDLEENHASAPKGSYLGSCGGCAASVEMNMVTLQDDDGTLYEEELGQTVLRCSHCKNSRGELTGGKTSLVIDDCTHVGNSEGNLVCEDDPTTLPPAIFESLPFGTYQASCSGCIYTEASPTQTTPLLSCSACMTGEGSLVASKLGLIQGIDTCRNIRNKNGRLICDRTNKTEYPSLSTPEAVNVDMDGRVSSTASSSSSTPVNEDLSDAENVEQTTKTSTESHDEL